MVKSVKKTEILDGTYDGIWSSNMVRAYNSPTEKFPTMMPAVEVNLAIKSIGKKVKIDVIAGWLYVGLSGEDRRDLILKEII